VKLSVTFPNFRGDECEDAHKFINVIIREQEVYTVGMKLTEL